jgi:hypothetical protein
VMGHPPAVRAHSLDASIPSEARDV